MAAAKPRRSVKELQYFSFPRRCGGSGERSEPMGALMPHAALWVVQRIFAVKSKYGKICFNAARGFVGGAGKEYPFYFERVKVSMPHAALWVVQLF